MAGVLSFGMDGIAESAAYVYAAVTRPGSLSDLALVITMFFVQMLLLCTVVEATNSAKKSAERCAQIRSEIKDSGTAVIASTAFSLGWFKWIYPMRWGHDAPIFPPTPATLVLESAVWAISFEVTVYFVHRTLHLSWFFRHFHAEHHAYKEPTAYAAQAIHWFEAIMFAGAAVSGSCVCPVSVAVQYSWGIALLLWSIYAHDEDGKLDGGFHYEHHLHYKNNFGFLGFADVLFGTVWWGQSRHDHRTKPLYILRPTCAVAPYVAAKLLGQRRSKQA